MSSVKCFIFVVMLLGGILAGCGGGFDGDNSEAVQIGESIFGSDSISR
ncbi:MAG TPA: hypothetical protein VKY57_12940 [Chitinispirillaceae bacterium]|jgi:hypothetical protein|nr:hypothetical protein [Chitinispirillaceae bacterium]